MFDALRAPFRVSSKDQFRVRNAWTNVASRKIKNREQLCAAIEPGVRRDPIPVFETGGLPLGKRLFRRPQQRVAQANRSLDPGIAGIRTTVSEGIRERLQQRPVNRSTVPVINSDNSAQSVTLPSTCHDSNSRRVGPAHTLLKFDLLPSGSFILPT